MYAIIKTGGKQYRVKKNDVIDVELLGKEQGSKFQFDEILFVGDGSENEVGHPFVAGYIVTAEIVTEIVPGPKVMSVKYKASHNQRRKFGHRQKYARVKITDISSSKHKEKRHGT